MSFDINERTLKPNAKGLANILWVDPGVTTGFFVASVRPRWLDGEGLTDWESLGKAIKFRSFTQIGRYARVWDDVKNKARFKESNSKNMFRAESARNGGAEMTTSLAEELRQTHEFQKLMECWPDAVWGYEDFIPRSLNQTREFLAPVRLFSRFESSELLYGTRGRVPFKQNASTAKTTATDERLGRAGLYRPGMPHATDAARHAATFLRRARADAELRAQAWPRLFRAPYVLASEETSTETA